MMGAKFDEALKRHQAGALAEAARLYQDVLATEPEHADALHLLGVLLHQAGQSSAAVELIGRAIAINPRFAAYHSNLGNALRVVGEIQAARQSYERSLALSRTASAYLNLANLELAQAELRAARRGFEAALRCDANACEALFGLGCVAMAESQPAEAADWFGRAVALKPDFLAGWNALGNACSAQGDVEGAMASYRKGFEPSPPSYEATINLGNLYLQQERFDLAAECYERAARFFPADRDAAKLCGIAAINAGRYDHAIGCFKRSVEIDPAHGAAHQLLGHSLVLNREFERSLACFERALSLNARDHEALNGLGTAFEGLGRYVEAGAAFCTALALEPEKIEYLVNVGLNRARRKDRSAVELLDRALQLDPEHIEAHRTRADILLSFGEYRSGFAAYEWRWRSVEFANSVRNFTQPLWDGRPLGGRTILLHAEQGYGDTIQFARFIPTVLALGGVVFFEVQAPLYRLLTPSDMSYTCVRRGIDALLGFEVHCPLLSLPCFLGTELDALPPPVALPGHRENGSRAPGRESTLRVGLAWAGNPEHPRDAFRSIPLAAFLPLQDIPGISLVSLQKAIPATDSGVFPNFAMEVPLRHCIDFFDTAEVIAGLDLVISVDTAVAHLAASLGKPVWLMLPEAADWRWGIEGQTTPWYPAMRIFRLAAGQSRERYMQHLLHQLGLWLAEQSLCPEEELVEVSPSGR